MTEGTVIRLSLSLCVCVRVRVCVCVQAEDRIEVRRWCLSNLCNKSVSDNLYKGVDFMKLYIFCWPYCGNFLFAWGDVFMEQVSSLLYHMYFSPSFYNFDTPLHSCFMYLLKLTKHIGKSLICVYVNLLRLFLTHWCKVKWCMCQSPHFQLNFFFNGQNG